MRPTASSFVWPRFLICVLAVALSELAPFPTWQAAGSEAPAFEASPRFAVTSVRTVGHRLIVNGKPVLLFGYWAPMGDSAALAWAIDRLGINVVVEHPDDASAEQIAAAAGGRYWQLVRSRPGMKLGAPLSNELGVSWEDEPEGHGSSPTSLAPTPGDGRVNFQNYTQHLADRRMKNLRPGDLVRINDSTTMKESDYTAYLANLGPRAVVGYDIYPLNMWDPAHPEEGVASLYHYTLAAKASLPQQTPLIAYIETWSWRAAGKPLTAAAVTAEAKAALTAGATGIFPWALPGETSSAVADAFAQFTQAAHLLAPILLAPQVAGIASSWASPVKIGGRRLSSVRGVVRYAMILTNTSERTVRVQQHLLGLGNQLVTNAVDGTTVRARDGLIAVTIPAYDWYIAEYSAPTR